MFVGSAKCKFACGLGSWENDVSDGDVQQGKLSVTHHKKVWNLHLQS